MHMKTTLTLDEDKQQSDAIRQQCNEIMGTLYSLANVEQSELQNIQVSKVDKRLFNINSTSVQYR